MNILYLGSSERGTTSSHRAAALERLGHTVTVQDPYRVLLGGSHHKVWHALHYRSGYRMLQGRAEAWCNSIPGRFDVAWVDGGELLGPGALEVLRSRAKKTILYNHDDPTGPRDGARFASVRRSVPLYDICVAVRNESVPELYQLGARRVVKVWRSYDEVAHCATQELADLLPGFRSDVAFIGTWIRQDKRDEFMARLLELGVPLSIWGARWDRSPLWPRIKHAVRGGALAGREYVAAIQGARVVLGLLSAGNRDLHTTRSMEIPYAGGLLCAKRTPEHLALFRENTDAVFWNDADECAEACLNLLASPTKQNAIRENGRARILTLKVGHQDICSHLLECLFE